MPSSARLKRPFFNHLDKARQPGVGLLAVQRTVVDGQRDICHGADLYRIDPVDFAHDYALFDFAHAQDGGLRLVDDDGGGKQRTRCPMIGNGEGAALHVLAA